MASGRRQVPLFLFPPAPPCSLPPHERGGATSLGAWCVFGKRPDGPTAPFLLMHESICRWGDRRTQTLEGGPLGAGGTLSVYLSFTPRFPPGHVGMYRRSRRRKSPQLLKNADAGCMDCRFLSTLASGRGWLCMLAALSVEFIPFPSSDPASCLPCCLLSSLLPPKQQK